MLASSCFERGSRAMASRACAHATHASFARPARRRISALRASSCSGRGAPASSDFSYATRLIEFLLLGNVALRARKQIKWDPVAMKATNAPDADKFIKGVPYRAGWELPV